jgi:hypothetical protein
MNIINFWSNRPANNESTSPVPAKSLIPEWFSNSSKYWKNENGEYIVVSEDGERSLGFKSCPALLDIFSAGYLLKTPCDLYFYKMGEEIYVTASKDFADFCGKRAYMNEFFYPTGYSKSSFHWYANWGLDLPNGYSALYLHPLNRFDLPFLTTNGIIDSDKYGSPGLIPFFIKEGFTGYIPKGTPYAQVIPFKREDWKIKIDFIEEEEMIKRHTETINKYRVSNGGIYKRETWSKKNYD